jgi:REP element-mobilizing transposase RayT
MTTVIGYGAEKNGEIVMGRASRSEEFQTSEVSIVHVVQRCVRRAWLAGFDDKTGQDFSYRREWIRRRMESLASVFAIDLLTYAIMSNHMHLILRNRPDVVSKWSDHEVAIRWLRVFPGRRLEEHLAEPTESDVQMLVNQPERLAVIRERLSDISWFMRALSEPIARMANRQDKCTGRFWEGRFKALRIMDETGLLACAMYVDLNPIRAAIVESPDKAVHTSAHDRIHSDRGKMIEAAAFDLVPITNKEAGDKIKNTPIEQLKQQQKTKKRNPTGRKIACDAWLSPLTLDKQILSLDPQVHAGGLRASDRGFLQISREDYLLLLNWTAKQGIDGVAAKVPTNLATLLTSLGIDSTMWRDMVWHFKKYFGRCSCVGSPEAMAADALKAGKRWHRGQRAVRGLYLAA